MNRSIFGVPFALGIPLVLALAVGPASADETRPQPQQGKQQTQECVPKAHAKTKAKHLKASAHAQRKAHGRVGTVAQRKPSAEPKPPPHAAQPAQPSEACPPGMEKKQMEKARPAEPPPEQPREIERQKEPAPQQMREPQQQPEQGYLPAQPAQPQPPPMMREPEQQPAQAQQPGENCQFVAVPEPGFNEQALCSALAERAQLQYEEIPGGAAIVLTPKAGYALIDLRRSIDDLEFAVQKNRDRPIPAVQQRCYLFDLYRRTGDLPKVMEGRNMMRLHFTTPKNTEVTPLRTEAYQFACTPPQ